jgi:hypothetical protein
MLNGLTKKRKDVWLPQTQTRRFVSQEAAAQYALLARIQPRVTSYRLHRSKGVVSAAVAPKTSIARSKMRARRNHQNIKVIITTLCYSRSLRHFILLIKLGGGVSMHYIILGLVSCLIQRVALINLISNLKNKKTSNWRQGVQATMQLSCN